MWERSEGANSRSIFVRELTLGLRVPTLGLRGLILGLCELTIVQKKLALDFI